MKKLIRFLVFFLLWGLLLAFAGFLALAYYYRSHFPVNTWINGIYCTGKTVEQVNEELAYEAAAGDASVCIVDAQAGSWEITMEEGGVWPDYTEALEEYLEENTKGFWLDHLEDTAASQIQARGYRVEDETFLAAFHLLPFVEEEGRKPAGVLVSDSPEGFVLQDGNKARLDPDRAFSYVKDCLARGETVIYLQEGDCYRDLADSQADAFQRALWQQICEFTQRCGGIVYDMGAEQIPLTAEIACRFLEKEADGRPKLDGQGALVVDPEGVRLWVEELALRYDTCDTEKDFAATRGETVKVKYVTYGTKLDVDAEAEYLLGALTAEEPRAENHVPAYSHKAYARGLDDIGDTYIEVDLTKQKLYYYVDGEIALETDVVTGNLSKKYDTPEGINFVYAKQRNRTLRGPGYSSFVRYWMPVKGGIGLHDASWRSKFGGEIYKTNGSHGCINMAIPIAAQLYEMVEIGTPVIMFY